MGGTARQDENLVQLSKVSKKKPPTKKILTGLETFLKCFVFVTDFCQRNVKFELSNTFP